MSNSVSVTLEFTPNPESLKYVVNQQVLPRGAIHFTDVKVAKGKSKLAEKILEDSRIKSVMLGTSFVTVNLQSQDDMMTVHESIVTTIRNFFESGQPVVESLPDQHRELNEIERKIVEILDRDVRPAVAMDGGDIEFEKYEDGYVYLRMQGSCAGCPSSLMTLKHGVENRMKEAIPEIKEIIPV